MSVIDLDGEQPPPRSQSLFHLLVFTSVFIPLACLPYIPIRRRLIDLHRSIHALSTNTVSLHHEINLALLQARLRKEESLKLAEQLRALQAQHDVATKRTQDAEKARLSTEKALSERINATAEWVTQRESDRRKAEGELKRQVDVIKRRAERDRLPPVVLHDVSTSLADMASFIEEVEIQQGLDQSVPRDRGVDRMRQLALKLHTMAKNSSNSPPSGTLPMMEPTPAAVTTAGTTMNNNDSDKTNLTPGHDSGGSVKREAGDEGAAADDENKEPEEALETHEVVELNKFTTKRKWIEEKIELLESMPPIEVFAGVESLLSLSENIPLGLPTRPRLDHWLEEHDKIEKDTEIFDAEDMSKLKKLTKAATQRNLSPEDTDLIELTLTTLLALDKLLHLLRDRSESLDLLGLRLTWEEMRVAAWRDRRSLLDDLRAFLTNRARWSLDTYELPPSTTPSSSPAMRFTSPSPTPPPRPSPSPSRRRDSAASLASMSSDTSTTGPSSAFSRSTRYKLAELLSHDAALFSGRLTALNHSKVMAAGKTLDRLIDASRKPVPDEILDEQDRLEDKGIKEIETVGKFAMIVVMQWKRADEHYNDTKKDQAAAQALLAELNNAKLQHPVARHDAAFMSRAQALTRRLAVKGDPALPHSSFPRPVHPLFPDQGTSNEAIVKTLSTELADAVKLARQAETAALAYHAGLEAVKNAEMLRDQMQSADGQLEQLSGKLLKGVHDELGHGDGSPLDLEKELCLDPMRHATYLALLPSVVQELDQTDRAAERVLREGRVASLRLKELPGVDVKLKQSLVGTMERLEARRQSARRVEEDVLAKAQRLKEARHLWGILNDIMGIIQDATKQAVDGMDGQKWNVREVREGAPLTPDPDSPGPSHTPLPAASSLTPSALLQRLDMLEQRISGEFKVPLSRLSLTLEKRLYEHLRSSSDGLLKHIDDVRGMARLWDGILKQAADMLNVQRDMHGLEGKIDTLQASIDDAREDILNSGRSLEEAATTEADFKTQAVALQNSVRTLTDELATRLPLVSRTDGSRASHPRSNHSHSNFLSPYDQRLNSFKQLTAPTVPFDLSKLDAGVRAEVNAYALGLAGGMQAVNKKLDYLHISRLARVSDAASEVLLQDVNISEQGLSNIRTTLEFTIQRPKPSGLDANLGDELSAIGEQLDQFAMDSRTRLSRPALSLRQALEALQAAPGAHDSPVHGVIVTPRVKSADEVSRRADTIDEVVAQLRVRIVEAQREEERRLRNEKERREAERARLEKERIAEESARLEQERIQAEADARLAEAQRLEHERLENEERARLEKERAEAEAKEKLQREREEAMVAVQEQQRKTAVRNSKTPDEDVFGLRVTPSLSSTNPLSQEMADLRSRIASLRSRLRSLSLNSLVRPSFVVDSHAAAALPTPQEASSIKSDFAVIVEDTAALPKAVVENTTVESELRSLRSELDAGTPLVQRLVQLGQFADKVAACDHALSDLLEHADCYPAAPSAQHLLSSHISDARLPCEEQLANRLTFTRDILGDMSQMGAPLADDLRVVGEQRRLQQTWTELADMCTDRINGTRSRPTSSVSSTGRSSILTTASGSGSGLSVQPKLKPSLNGNAPRRPRPSGSSTRRAVSGAHDPIARPSTHMSTRSVSGPSGAFSSLFNTTFASRQRTTSLASIQSASATPVKRPMSPIARPRTLSKRPGSPTFSEMSGHSIASTPSRSTWSRAPRQSFDTVPKNFQAPDRKRKAYVANPKSKLDVAVGNVVNNFRVPVTIHAAGEGWKDQSGKYWIGDVEPKLCFCRILRSQTVMVRVGGGWSELSKFLRGHFADLLAELPPSPPRKEERWISAAIVREAMETPATVMARGLSTPEPQGPSLLPSFQLSTPNGTSPQSIKTASSPGGSPGGLTPFQFMRRADPGVRSASPSPSKSARMKPATPSAAVTPARTNIWRP